VSCTADSGNAYRVLVGIREKNKPLEGFRRMWEDRIKMNLQEVGWEA
jgi:hypothetical protein